MDGKSEVSDLEPHVLVEERVSDFEVTMEHSVPHHVVDGFNHLLHEEPDFDFCQASRALLDQVVEGLVRAKIEDEVDVVDVLEVVHQPNQVLVLQQFLDLDFTLELELSVVCMLSLAGVCGSEVFLINYLACELFLLRRNFDDPVTGGEPTLT